ncbi:MAG: LLM class flavin-dependent oxidoreductase [Acidimicrobiia bacterium]|nr:LLM class flavin-dependent oxidoreductase [Acidimicrobiia bacterium]
MPRGRPQLLFGGFVPAAFARAARFGTGWVAPSFGHDQLVAGVAGVRAAWKDAGRDDRPRVVVERYFCLGADATSHARRYISHYYGTDYADQVMADTVTNPDLLDQQLQRLGDAGCDDVIFLPCTPDRDQVGQLAHALRASAPPYRPRRPHDPRHQRRPELRHNPWPAARPAAPRATPPTTPAPTGSRRLDGYRNPMAATGGASSPTFAPPRANPWPRCTPSRSSPRSRPPPLPGQSSSATGCRPTHSPTAACHSPFRHRRHRMPGLVARSRRHHLEPADDLTR